MDFVASPLLKSGFGFGGIISRTLPEHLEKNGVLPSSVIDSDEKWMAFALLEAMNGVGWSSPNPAVGCVVVSNQQIVASGFTQSYGGKHAERMAFEFLDRIPDLSRNLEVFITLEPCSHQGKQPPCVDLLLHPSVTRVVIGCKDPHPLVSGNGIRILNEHSKVVKVGVLENEVRAWHFPFLFRNMQKKPLWIAKWAESRDGVLADAQGESKWISNERSRAYTHWLRQKYDAILVGAGTWVKDRPRLTVRDCAKPHHRNPVILVHDPKKTIPLDALDPQVKVFHQSSISELRQAVEDFDFGFELQSVFCEGGARTLNELFRIDAVCLVHRFVGSKFLGASKHRITEFHPDFHGSGWQLGSSVEFGNDHLQEWVKCF